jgi:hypothetical protein
MEDLKKRILEEDEKGNIVIYTPDGLMLTKLDDLMQQPLEAILYDLNRNETVIMTFLDDPKWVNDFALIQVTGYFYDKCKQLEEQNKKLLFMVENGLGENDMQNDCV